MEDKAPTGRTGVLTRDVPKSECEWLQIDLKQGMVVFEYRGPTYGCITRSGTAVLLERNEYPFIEIPTEAVRWD